MKFYVITLILLNPIMAMAESFNYENQANSDVIVVASDASDAASGATGIIQTPGGAHETIHPGTRIAPRA